MSHVLIVYASTDGQTRKVARHLLRHVVSMGHNAELLPAEDADAAALQGTQIAFLCGSIHAGHYQTALVDFASRNSDALSDMPAHFFSLSLAAAGHDAEDWKGLERISSEFSQSTGWTPTETHHVAGAYRPSQYDVFRRFIMRRIIAAKDPGADLSEDHEYTNWTALEALAEAAIAMTATT